jgi:signal transduction histidine kinase
MKLLASPARTAEEQKNRRRLALTRRGWLVGALVLLVSFATGIPRYYHTLFRTCPPAPPCTAGQLMPGNLQALAQLHLSLQTYAILVTALNVAVSLLFWGVGILLFWRKSQEWMGLFVSFLFIVFGSSGATDTFLLGDPALAQTPVFMTVLVTAVGLLINIVQWPALGAFLVTFPTGRFTPRWSWVIIPLCMAQDGLFWLGVASGPALLFAGDLVLVFGSMLALQVYRYRRIYNAVQRQQTKWFVFACLVGITLGVLVSGLSGVVPAFGAPDSWYQLLQAAMSPLIISLLIPPGLAIAILRYRLWDIDVIINRTVVYGTLTLSVIGLYILVVVGLGTLIQAQGNVLLSLLATGVVAILFQPLRAWLQRGVNRLMYGERDNPYLVLARLGQRLEAALAPESILPTIVETVALTLKLPYVAIELETPADPSTSSPATSIIGAAYGVPRGTSLRWPLVYQQELLGALLVAPRAGEAFRAADQRLLADLARQAGVAAHAVRLTTALQQARERLVLAREEERRRLRRDLHDGLGPQLAALTLKAGSARALFSQDPAEALALLKDLETTTQRAVADIRRLVYALRPPTLDERGLVAAIQECAASAGTHQRASEEEGLQVTVETPSCLPPLPAAVELAAYRITQEALTNVVRHAGARHGVIRLTLAEALCLEISDDGAGLPPEYQRGVGLASMRERAEELGGTCLVETRASGGVRVLARLPVPPSAAPPGANGANDQPERERA